MSLEHLAEAEVYRLRAVDLSGFMEQDAVSWPFLCYPLVPCNLVTLFGGHGGAGKSTLQLVMMAHGVCRRPWAGLSFDCGRAVYVSLEDPGELVRYRLRMICEAYRLDPATVARNLIVLDGSGGDASLAVEVNDKGVKSLIPTPVLQEVEAAAEGADWIAIDNASDAYDADENARRMVRGFIRRLADIAIKNNAALTLLAHIDKRAAIHGSNGNSYSGSTAWHNSPRSRLALTANEEAGTLTLTQEKLNVGKRADPIELVMNAEGVPMPIVVDPFAPDPLAERNRADDDLALVIVRAARAAGITVPTGTAGISTSFHAVAHLPEVPEAMKSKAGRTRFHTSLVRLERAGILQRVEFRDRHRNTRQRWELTQPGQQVASETALRQFVTSPHTPRSNAARKRACITGAAEGSDAALTQSDASNAGLAYMAARDGDL